MGQKFGQHFLVDQNILQQMQRSLADIKNLYGLKYCLEIGPGEGALTKRLKSVFETENIIAFEADVTLERKIAKFFPLEQVVWGDVLKQEIDVEKSEIRNQKPEAALHLELDEHLKVLACFAHVRSRNLSTKSELLTASTIDSGSSPEGQRQLHAFANDYTSTSSVGQAGGISINKKPTHLVASQTMIAGNLPYYITSPIIRKFFQGGQFDHGWFLIQKEVADKISSDAKKKSYLRWIINYQYHVQTIIDVPPEAFAPPPRVDSAVIVIRKISVERTVPLSQIIAILEVVNQYSRKTLGKIHKLLSKRNINLTVPEALKMKRVEELEREEMQMISL